MKPRIDLHKVPVEFRKAMLGLEAAIEASPGELDRSLLDLVRLRVSQINGCAMCIDMHSKDLRAAGETEQRLYALVAWRETPFFDDRERSALAWAEAVTLVAEQGVSDELFREAREHFTEDELLHLTLAVVSINGWNRLNVAFRTVPGGYEPAGHHVGSAKAN
jgi:AhpD family alkylhydroperoxidase